MRLLVAVVEAVEPVSQSFWDTGRALVAVTLIAAFIGALVAVIVPSVTVWLKRRWNRKQVIQAQVADLIPNIWYFGTAIQQLNQMAKSGSTPQAINGLAERLNESYIKSQIMVITVQLCPDPRVKIIACNVQEQLTNLFDEYTTVDKILPANKITELEDDVDTLIDEASLLQAVVEPKAGKKIRGFRSENAAVQILKDERNNLKKNKAERAERAKSNEMADEMAKVRERFGK